MTDTRTPIAGDCIAVCVCCHARVNVPPIAGIPPMLQHGADWASGEPCPRAEWPIQDAIRWDDGEIATINNTQRAL